MSSTVAAPGAPAEAAEAKRRRAGMLPLISPAVSAGALLTFVLSIADFGTPSIVGGKVRVLATTAFNLFTSEMTGNPGLASATSTVLVALSMVAIVM